MSNIIPVDLTNSVWTQFWDMHSGGGLKEDFSMLYIEAPKDEAISVFYSRFGHNPHRVSCTCCGADYSITSDNLQQLTGYHRNLRHASPLRKEDWWEVSDEVRRAANEQSRYLEPDEEIPDGWHVDDRFFKRGEQMTLSEYLAQDGIEYILAAEIQDFERNNEPPEEGYVWV